MTKFAIIEKKTNTVVKRVGSKGARVGDKLLVSPTVAGWDDDAYRILPIEEVDPAFDAATQLRSDWDETVLADKVIRERTVTDKSAEQLATEAELHKEASLDRMDPLLLRTAFEQENRIRSLEGKDAVTGEHFRATLKDFIEPA